MLLGRVGTPIVPDQREQLLEMVPTLYHRPWACSRLRTVYLRPLGVQLAPVNFPHPRNILDVHLQQPVQALDIAIRNPTGRQRRPHIQGAARLLVIVVSEMTRLCPFTH